MRRILLSLSLCITVSSALQAQVITAENFNGTTGTALPSGWAINPVTTTSWKTGVSANLSSPEFNVPDLDGRMVMINDSKEDPSVINNNALLSSPSISLSGQSGPIFLSFDMAFYKQRVTSGGATETLKIQISTNGGTSWTVLQDMPADTVSKWETQYINLSAYAGQSDVKIGFLYGDANQLAYGAAIDNFKIFKPASNDIQLTSATPTQGSTSSYKLANTPVTIAGSIFNNGGTAITAYTIKYKQGANPVVSHPVTGVNIAPFTSATFTNPQTFTVPAAGNYPIKVWVELPGDVNQTNDSANAYAVGVPFMPVKKLVFEEGTGTWCGACPQGAVVMEKFAELHPSKAAQIAVHNADPMTVSAYDSYIAPYINHAYPVITIDRRSLIFFVHTLETVYAAMKDDFGFAEVTMGTPSVSGTTITVPVTIKPAVNITNPKLALVITESNVKGTGPDWLQTNYFANGVSGPMGGWETQPAHVDNVTFHFVARSISPSPAGDAAGLPATLIAGTTYNATLTATLNSAWKTADLQYIAMLMDGTSSAVLNSAFSSLPTLQPTLPGTSAVANVEAGIEKAQLYPNPASDIAYLQVELKDKTSATLTITDAIGRSVAAPKTAVMRSGNNILEIPTANLANGVYFINLNTGKGNVALKLQVIK